MLKNRQLNLQKIKFTKRAFVDSLNNQIVSINMTLLINFKLFLNN